MKRTAITLAALVLVIAVLLFTAFFGLNLGIFKIDEISQGITLGLDLVGGSEIVYEAEIPAGTSDSQVSEGMETALTMMRQRLNKLGYTEANAYIASSTRLVIEIPNVDDPEEAVQMLGTTANIQFRDYQDNVILEGSDIASATAAFGQVSESSASQYYVRLQLTEEGYRKFVDATEEIAAYDNDNNYLAIMMDDAVISAPFVSERLDTDTPIITLGSSATVENARYLAEIISAGQLPFALREAKLQSVGATLGERSLETSILAGLIGIVLVLVYIPLFLVVMSAFHVNLSLPGIAGIILTIGMAVDANVIIYERLREELRAGKTLRSSVDAGFRRAYTAIIDSNVTTIIAAVVLLWQGTGTILGFAKTLLIGVILSMICMLIIPNLLLRSLAAMRHQNLRAYGA